MITIPLVQMDETLIETLKVNLFDQEGQHRTKIFVQIADLMEDLQRTYGNEKPSEVMEESILQKDAKMETVQTMMVEAQAVNLKMTTLCQEELFQLQIIMPLNVPLLENRDQVIN